MKIDGAMIVIGPCSMTASHFIQADRAHPLDSSRRCNPAPRSRRGRRKRVHNGVPEDHAGVYFAALACCFLRSRRELVSTFTRAFLSAALAGAVVGVVVATGSVAGFAASVPPQPGVVTTPARRTVYVANRTIGLV
jgi:hypothetical protein